MSVNVKMWEAVWNGNVETVQTCLREDHRLASLFEDELGEGNGNGDSDRDRDGDGEGEGDGEGGNEVYKNTGRSVLMIASKFGYKEVVRVLLEYGAPWNALDRAGNCAGDYAVASGHQEIVDMLVNAGVQAELILGAIEAERDHEECNDYSEHNDEAEEDKEAEEDQEDEEYKEAGEDQEEEDDDSDKDVDSHTAAPGKQKRKRKRTSMSKQDKAMQGQGEAKNVRCSSEGGTTGGKRDEYDDSADYLQKGVRLIDDGKTLIDSSRDAVMMEWEKPLMELHAALLCGEDHVLDDGSHTGNTTSGTNSTNSTNSSESDNEAKAGNRDLCVLNIGFGLGLIDEAFQRRSPKLHVIVEAHPQVLHMMKQNGWNDKPNVMICAGRWQDEVPKLIENSYKFDAIFFDTYGEHYSKDMRKFHSFLPELVKNSTSSRYSFFAGFCPRQPFFQGVACQVAQLELNELGFSQVEFYPVRISAGSEAADIERERKGVSKIFHDQIRRRYFWDSTYHLPIAIFG